MPYWKILTSQLRKNNFPVGKSFFSYWVFSGFQLVSLCSFSLSKNFIIIDIYIVYYDLICSQPHISTCCVTNPKTWQTLQVFHSLSLANWWR